MTRKFEVSAVRWTGDEVSFETITDFKADGSLLIMQHDGERITVLPMQHYEAVHLTPIPVH
ncbi:hypothetical protein Q9295_10105 [Xinfangfangia sp. CPCC 101601]|uniref:Uncharacterized protein n=1 Tax=Pseudogemmobacter lacusdianii TaxID=3069608 RepID=A0ABU0VZV4_9RHOB|nr:hypothetical protein [Xinfangfangia sp. CPCC 101601]MDQ2066730.1 hypothetical protein [Xinfangfangia sp. CPCC 101601]